MCPQRLQVDLFLSVPGVDEITAPLVVRPGVLPRVFQIRVSAGSRAGLGQDVAGWDSLCVSRAHSQRAKYRHCVREEEGNTRKRKRKQNKTTYGFSACSQTQTP